MTIKSLTIFFTSVASFHAALLALSPEKIENLRLDFVFFIVSKFYIEIVAIFLVFLLLDRSSIILRGLNKVKENTLSSYKEKSANNKFFIFCMLLLIIFVFCYSLYLIFYIGRARYYYITELSLNDYKYSLINKANSYISEGKYNDASIEFDKLHKYYPNSMEAKSLKSTTQKLESVKNYATQLFENHKNQGLNRKGMLMLAESARLQPSNQIVKAEFNYNYEKLVSVFNMFNDIESECAKNNYSDRLVENKNFYFDISLATTFNGNKLCEIVNTDGKLVIDKSRNSWSFDYLTKVYSLTSLENSENIWLRN